MQASPSMRSLGNVSGVVHVAPPPGAAPPGEAHLEDLTALQSKISDPAANVHDAGSECRMAMDRLVGLAAARGPGGEQARTALRDIYARPIGEDKRVALLNAAFAKMGDHASITVNYMGALAPPPPKGDNGGAHIDAAQKRLARQLGNPFDRELNLLAEGRTVTEAEMQAASPKLNWRETISLATPADAQRGFSQVLNDVATHQRPVTIWVADSTGHCVPVVAQPTPSGAIRFHVITSPTDGAGHEIGKDLAELTGDDCVIVHKATTPHLVLQHLNADFDDDRGAGGVMREHLDDWSNKTPEDRRAANLAGQAALFEAAAIRGPDAAPVAKSPSPTSVEGKFSKLENSFNKQELTKRSGQVHSAFDGMSEAIGLSRRLSDPNVPMADRMRLQLSSPYAPGSTFAIAAPEVRNFYQPARALAENFNESKAPKLFAKVGPGNPLGPVSIALNKLGSGESATHRTIVTQQKLLQECHDASKAKDLPRLNRALKDIEAAQVSMVEDIDSALGELEVLQSNAAALDPELAAEATVLIEALQDYRACLQGEHEPNVYADLVAFAKQATAFGPTLQHAQSLFQQVGSTPRAIATPEALQPPLPEIVVRLPADVNVPGVAQVDQTPLAPALTPVDRKTTREELTALASAAGFFKDNAGQTTNVWADMATTVNTHDTAKGAQGPLGERAGYLERRKLSKDVERRLNEMPRSNRGLVTAVMNAGPAPTMLAKSPLWAHLNAIRIPDIASNQQPLLAGTGQGVVVLTAQLIVRMKMLSEEVIKHAAYVTTNDPTDRRNIHFKRCLQELQDYIQSSGAKLERALTELKSVMDSEEGGRGRTKADAATMWTALEALRVQFQDPAGTAQQLVSFTKTALGSDDNLRLAADAVTL